MDGRGSTKLGNIGSNTTSIWATHHASDSFHRCVVSTRFVPQFNTKAINSRLNAHDSHTHVHTADTHTHRVYKTTITTMMRAYSGSAARDTNLFWFSRNSHCIPYLICIFDPCITGNRMTLVVCVRERVCVRCLSLYIYRLHRRNWMLTLFFPSSSSSQRVCVCNCAHTQHNRARSRRRLLLFVLSIPKIQCPMHTARLNGSIRCKRCKYHLTLNGWTTIISVSFAASKYDYYYSIFAHPSYLMCDFHDFCEVNKVKKHTISIVFSTRMNQFHENHLMRHIFNHKYKCELNVIVIVMNVKEIIVKSIYFIRSTTSFMNHGYSVW